MVSVDDLNRLRTTYEQALSSYEVVSLTLNRHMVTGKRPSPELLERERDAREQLDNARRLYLDAWMLP